jgi:hypothetical protein
MIDPTKTHNKVELSRTLVKSKSNKKLKRKKKSKKINNGKDIKKKDDEMTNFKPIQRNCSTPNIFILNDLKKLKLQEINSKRNFKTTTKLYSREFYYRVEDFKKLDQDIDFKKILIIGSNNIYKEIFLNVLIDKRIQYPKPEESDGSVDSFVSDDSHKYFTDEKNRITSIHKTRFLFSDLGNREQKLETLIIDTNWMVDFNTVSKKIRNKLNEDIKEKLMIVNDIDLILLIIPFDSSELRSFTNLMKKLSKLKKKILSKIQLVFVYFRNYGSKEDMRKKKKSKKNLDKMISKLKNKKVKFSEVFDIPVDIMLKKSNNFRLKTRDFIFLKTKLQESKKISLKYLNVFLNNQPSMYSLFFV